MMLRMFRSGILVLIFVAGLFGQEVIFSQSYSWSPLLHNNSSNGVNGNVHAITVYQNNIVVAGGFSQAGGLSARNIAIWNGSAWSALGSGVGTAGDTVYSLAVFNNELYAGGSFSNAGGIGANNIAKWNGSAWSQVGGGVDGEVRTLLVFNTLLVAGGNFENTGNSIAGWTGSFWVSFGPGFTNGGSTVNALAVFNGQLVAAGRFSQSGSTTVNNIAVWNNTSWQPLGSGIGSGSERVFALTAFNNTLVAGGRFSAAGGVPASNIARWTGSLWQNIGGASDIDDEVNVLSVFNGELVAGGNFRFASGTYASRIVKWNGTAWTRMVTGGDDRIEALCVRDTSLYAGGEGTYTGGFIANHIARWSNQPTSTISGQVFYADNNQPVQAGVVKSYRIDKYTREMIIVDSAGISNGNYVLPRNLHDTLRVIAFPNDELDFVPTHYPSTIDWSGAVTIVPNTNQVNINIMVYRVSPGVMASGTIGGHIFLNLTIPGNPPGSYPYEKDAILYVKQGNSYSRFAISRSDNSYVTSILNAGTYDLYAFRPGYRYAHRSITVGSSNLDTINFYLDTMNVIGLENISTRVPKGYSLSQNYPNPFNPVTSIRFAVPVTGIVKLTVYNVLGQTTAILVNQELRAGEYRFTFDASDLPSGIYFYTLQTESYTTTRKMVLVK